LSIRFTRYQASADLHPALGKPLGDLASDEAARACQEDFHHAWGSVIPRDFICDSKTRQSIKRRP
jgi:hypothetical protein